MWYYKFVDRGATKYFQKGECVMTDTIRLKQILLEKGITIRELSALTGIKVQTLSNKINNVTEFTQSELVAIQNALNLSNKQMREIFLVEKVD